jgi:hypothetical protein
MLDKTIESARQRRNSKLYSAEELRSMKFPHLNWIVDGLIVEGLTLLAAKPKIGKSWMVLDIAIAAATGGKALGTIQVEQTPVIYYALEDNQRRMKRRMGKLLRGRDWPSGLHMGHSLPRIDEDGLDVIRDDVRQTGAGLIIIDTYAFIRPPTKGREENYSADYRWLSMLQGIASKLHIAIIVVHHTKKGVAEDVMDKINGSQGLMAAADTGIVLEPTKDGIVLTGRGRDLEDEIKKLVEFNRTTCRWEIVGSADHLDISPERRAIVNVLSRTPDSMSIDDIADEIGKNTGAVTKMLHDMAHDGQVRRTARGKYRVA